MMDFAADVALELARLEREALARVRKRMSEQQLGLAWIDLPASPDNFSRGIFPEIRS